MGTSFRHPERNALILGLLQGVPQGLMVPDQIHLLAPIAREADVTFFVCFGLFVPPVLAVISHFMNGRKNPVWWARVSEYVNLPNMIFWGSLSLGLLGWYSLRTNGISGGYPFCAFFVAGAFGFLIAGFLDRWLLRMAADAT